MKRVKFILIALTAAVLFPVLNGMGCDFSYEYQTDGYKQFDSCKFGQYTQINYPDPDKNNGYLITKGLYFYAFDNAAILVTGHENHTKEMTAAVMDSLNTANRSFWRQLNLRRLSVNSMIAYTDLPARKLAVIPFRGTLAMTDAKY